jgi:hypothetical protein
MNKLVVKLLACSVLVAGLSSAAAQDILFLTNRVASIRTSTDGAATSVFATTTGRQYRGVDVNPTTGVVYSASDAGGTATARPLDAFSPAGALVDTAFFNTTNNQAQLPVGYFNGFVYTSAGSVGGTGQSFGFVGTSSDTSGTNVLTSESFTSAGLGTAQSSDITFASSGGNNYLYSNLSGRSVQRALLNADGTAAAAFTNVATTAGVDKTGGAASGPGTGTGTGSATLPTNFFDLGLTASGRLLTVGETGFFLSDANQYTSNSISLNRVFAFSALEEATTGDMGVNARDFKLLGNNLYAVSTNNLYRYTFDDAAGTLTFVSAVSNGFGTANNIQIAGYTAVPEPSTYVMMLGGLGALLLFRRRRAS